MKTLKEGSNPTVPDSRTPAAWVFNEARRCKVVGIYLVWIPSPYSGQHFKSDVIIHIILKQPVYNAVYKAYFRDCFFLHKPQPRSEADPNMNGVDFQMEFYSRPSPAAFVHPDALATIDFTANNDTKQYPNAPMPTLGDCLGYLLGENYPHWKPGRPLSRLPDLTGFEHSYTTSDGTAVTLRDSRDAM